MGSDSGNFSLFDLLAICRSQRVALFVTVLVVFVLFIAYAVIKTPVYRSSIVVLPSEGLATNNFGALPAGLSGIAALAGLRSNDSSIVKSSAILESGAFLERFIKSNDLMPQLYAWIWDSQSGTWRDDVDTQDIPTLSQADKFFEICCLYVNRSKSTGLITISVESRNPEFSAVWANKLVEELNKELQVREIEEADLMIEILRVELEKTNNVGLQQAIYGLIEQQIQRKTLARVRTDFAYQIIDPAVPPKPDDHIRPNRAKTAVTGLLGGILLGIFVALLLNHIRILRQAVNTPKPLI